MTSPNAESPSESYTSSFLNSGGYKINCRYWEPAGTPRALVFIAHGMAEHCFVYDYLAKLLTSRRFYVFSHDHQGHGLSEGSRIHIDKFDQYIQDVLIHVESMKKKFPDLPVFAVAHSMGGTICSLLNLRKPNFFRGIVYIAPAVIPNPQTATTFKLALVRLFGRLLPRFPVAYLDYNITCRAHKRVKEIKKDPLYCHGYMKAGFALNFIMAIEELRKNLPAVEFPFLMLSGDNDKLCDVSGAKTLYQQAASEDKNIKIFPNAYHCLHLEPEGVREQVSQEITQWLEARS